MRINVLQHTPNEGPGLIQNWAHAHGYQLYVYHPYQFGFLPTADETDMLVILGGPMSPNDDLAWIKQERALIQELLANETPIFGACLALNKLPKRWGTGYQRSCQGSWLGTSLSEIRCDSRIT